jgi:hypothetical protein
LTDSGPVPGRQQRAVEPQLSTNDLHPGLAIIAQATGELLPSRQRPDVEDLASREGKSYRARWPLLYNRHVSLRVVQGCHEPPVLFTTPLRHLSRALILQ